LSNHDDLSLQGHGRAGVSGSRSGVLQH
jgi:hypothetical protein